MKRISRAFSIGGCLAVAFATAALGQDVSIAPIAPVLSDDPPEQMPVFKRALRPEFPDALRKTTEIGWAMADFFVDEHGKVLAWQTYATQPLLHTAVAAAVADRSKIEPARRSGKPVNSRVRMAILFNPASAGVKLTDATPRLLDAQVIVDPRRSVTPRGEYEPEVLWAMVSVDENGRVTAVRELLSELQVPVDRELKTWRFAPARRAGVAVSADVRLPVMLVPAPMMFPKGSTPPRVLRQVEPTYPPAMLRSGLRGEVLLEFTVDIEGRVRNASVVRSLNPWFDDAALQAIAKWKFEPARQGGVPLNTRMQLPVSFAIDQYGGGSDGIETTRRGDNSKLPPQLQYDVAPKPRALVIPKYPYALLREKVSGHAEVSMLIGPTGRVMLTKVLKADRPEFGFALQAACEGFEYEPALKNTQPTHALLGFEQDFGRSDSRTAPPAELDALKLEQKHPEKIVSARRLDHPLKPRVTRSPLYPSSLLTARTKGEALVEFLVGEDGKVLLPRIVSSSAPEFGYAAVQAVAAWQFTPPTVEGKPAITRVQVPFGFDPPPAETPAPASNAGAAPAAPAKP